MPTKRFYVTIFGIKIKIRNPLYGIQKKQYLKKQVKIQNGYNISKIKNAKYMVLFILPFEEIVSGGILSIFSLCQYTREILPEYSVFLVTEAGNKTYACSSWFHSEEKIYRWSQIMENLDNIERLIIHIPEYMSCDFYDKLPADSRSVLKKVPDLMINILNQNPLVMPSSRAVQKLFELTSKVTQTLAFREKNIQQLANQYHMPITTIYSYIDLSKWKSIPFSKKEKLILLSPDENSYRDQVIESINKNLPDFKLITINNMTFEQYMDNICKAFAVISFGEGYDGYLLQPAIVKTLSFAVYNETFFPNSEFLNLTNIYKSYQGMICDMATYIRYLLKNPMEYYTVISELRRLDTIHSEQHVINCLKCFYSQHYECFPEYEENNG